MKWFSTVLCLVAFGCAGGNRSLFNGKDLSQWEGDAHIWSVQDGAITGRTTAETKLKENNYLVWKGGEIEDFELHLLYRLENGNSGIYCRAARRAEGEKRQDPVFAWQADIDDKHQWTGVIMEWTGRERLVPFPVDQLRVHDTAHAAFFRCRR